MESQFKRIVKIALHVFNSILLIYGIFLAIGGTMILKDVRSFENFIDGKLFWIPYFTIFNGLMMAILSLLGFLATNKQDYKLLFAISAFIVLLIEIALVTWISTQRPDYTDSIRNFLTRSFNNYNIDKRDRSSWNRLQRQLQCCGIDRSQDWSRIYSNNQVPGSCCSDVINDEQALCWNVSPTIYESGCHQILFKRIVDHWSVLSLLAQIAAFVQLIVLVLSIIFGLLVKRAKVARDK